MRLYLFDYVRQPDFAHAVRPIGESKEYVQKPNDFEMKTQIKGNEFESWSI